MAVCPSFIGARVLRVTRLDNCGRPVYGPCSQVVSEGFVSVEISPEIQEGEDYTLRNAAGNLCVSERGQDTLQWFTVSIEFCQVDPQLFQLMNPTWRVVENAQGEPTGFRIGTRFSDRAGFALELWPKAATQGGSLCPEDAPDEAEPNGYVLLPYVLGTAPEAWTVEDGVATFTLNGRTRGGSQWGRGPYNITHDAAGNPSPLLEPIDDGAETGDPDHFHMDIVTLAPPTPQCGCQPLEAITPGAFGGEITISPDQANEACFEVSGSAGRQTIVDWGDGSDPVTTRVGREVCHMYMATGTYTVTVTDIDDPAKTSSYEVTIDEIPPPPAPEVTVAPTNGTAPLTVSATVNNHGYGDVTIDWGDGTAPVTVAGGSDDAPAVHSHTYTVGSPTPYTVTVTTVADPSVSSTATVNVAPEDLPDPTLTVTPASGPAPLDVTAEISNHGNGDVIINWGDDSEAETVPGGTDAVPAQYPHTYAEAGEYLVTVSAVNNPSAQATQTVTVAAPSAPDAPTALVVSAETTEGFTVGWTWDQGAGGPADNFEVSYRTPVGSGTWSTPIVVDSAETSAELTGLDAGTEYEVSVTAVGAGGTSDPLLGTGTTLAAPPADPTGVATADPTATSMTVNWSWDQGTGGPVTEFSVRYRTPAGSGTWSTPETVGAAARTHDITGLTAETEYEIGVTAIGDGGSSAEVTTTGSTTA